MKGGEGGIDELRPYWHYGVAAGTPQSNIVRKSVSGIRLNKVGRLAMKYDFEVKIND